MKLWKSKRLIFRLRVHHYDFVALHSMWIIFKGLMCLSTEWKLYTSRNSYREQLRNQLYGPPAGIEPTPVRCRCTALTTKLRR